MIMAMSAEQVAAAANPREDDVRTLTREVWTTFLGNEVPLLFVEDNAFVPDWSASVTIKGAWDGMVSLETTRAGAQNVTRSLLALDSDADDLADSDLVDAIGELVNMVGGNVKGLVPGPSRLSLPLVAAGRFAHGSSQAEVVRLCSTWAGEPLVVVVHAGRASASTAASTSSSTFREQR
jgi:chemotaxis protein CheX